MSGIPGNIEGVTYCMNVKRWHRTLKKVRLFFNLNVFLCKLTSIRNRNCIQYYSPCKAYKPIRNIGHDDTKYEHPQRVQGITLRESLREWIIDECIDQCCDVEQGRRCRHRVSNNHQHF